MHELLTRREAPQSVADGWPTSNRNPGRLRLGIPGRLSSESALLRIPVRGLIKMKSVVWLFVLAHNLMRMAVLAPQLIGWGTNPCAAGARTA